MAGADWNGGSWRWIVIAAVVVVAVVIAITALRSRSTSDLSAAAGRAESHLRSRGAKLDPAMLLILDYLDRRFGLPWVRPAVAGARALKDSCGTDPATVSEACGKSHVFGSFIRLIDPSARLTADQIAGLPNTLDTFTAKALYCKANALPATFPQEVEARIDTEHHDPAHAALGLQWAIEQGCLDRQRADVVALRARVIDALVDLAKRVPDDEAIEAVALLAYIGAWNRVQPEWLHTIATAQRDDGGWGERIKATPNDHTTTLALWALLEATRKGAAVAWVPQ